MNFCMVSLQVPVKMTHKNVEEGKKPTFFIGCDEEKSVDTVKIPNLTPLVVLILRYVQGLEASQIPTDSCLRSEHVKTLLGFQSKKTSNSLKNALSVCRGFYSEALRKGNEYGAHVSSSESIMERLAQIVRFENRGIYMRMWRHHPKNKHAFKRNVARRRSPLWQCTSK